MLWILPFPNYRNLARTFEDILRTLVLQALQINPGALTTGVNPITPAHLQHASGELDWMRLLNRALKGAEHTYIVCGAEILQYVGENTRGRLVPFLTRLGQSMSSASVTLFVPRRAIGSLTRGTAQVKNVGRMRTSPGLFL